MLVLSKMGVLWLLDLSDCTTIKVLTVHAQDGQSRSGAITKCIIGDQDKEGD